MDQIAHPIRPEDIHSLTDFLRNHKEHVDRLGKTDRPELLTVNGQAKVIVQDANAYQRLLELANRMETIQSVRQALDSMDRGEGISLEDLDREIRAKHGLSDQTGATGTEGR